MVAKTSLTGTCIGSLFYNFGGAHANRNAPSAKRLAEEIYSRGLNPVNIAITSPAQSVTRAQLKEIGFKATPVVYNNRTFMVHSLSSTEAAKNPIFQEIIKDKEEAYRKKIADQAAERERRRQQREAARIAQGKNAIDFRQIENGGAFYTRASSDLIRRLRVACPDVPVERLVAEIFGIGLAFFNTYLRHYSTDYLVRRINSELRVRGLYR